MKRFIIFFLFIFSFNLTFSSPNRVITTEEKIQEIEKQILELENKKKTLENLKKVFLESSEKERPTVALVLSGGGAKGAAHIGVLRVLEKYQIPIDYIVGTSAGSIVGAMYSVGYTPDEIEEVITSLEFYELFTNQTKRNLEDITQKLQPKKYPINLNLDKDFNLSLPMGVLNGEYVYLELKRIFSRAEGIHDFKKLPIPYMAITTDLQSGEAVPIQEGDLALATFKSMAIPTVLDPIHDNDHFYVDGGVSENFPVSRGIATGADIVIGVDITAETRTITSESNIIEILDTLSFTKSFKNTEIQKKYPDILITPDVKNINMLDFSDFTPIIEAGESAANSVDFALSKISDEERFSEMQKRRETLLNRENNFKIDEIEIIGNDILTLSEVEALKPNKELLTLEDILLWSEKIYTKSYINRVFYSIEGEKITFKVREDPSIKLRSGLFYVSDYGAKVEVVGDFPVFNKFNLSQKNYTVKAEFSEYPKISLMDFNQYNFFNRTYIMSAELSYGYSPMFLYVDNKKISTYKSSVLNANVSLGTVFFDKFVMGYTLGLKDIGSHYDSGLNLSIFTPLEKEGTYLTNSFDFYHDSLNNGQYPTSGTKFIFSAFSETEVKEGETFQGVFGHTSIHIPINKKWSFHSWISGGRIDNAIKAPLSELFSLGGLRLDTKNRSYTFYGLPVSSLYTDDFFIGYMGLQYELKPSLYLKLHYNVGTYNYISSLENKKKVWEDYNHGYGVGIGWDTFLGPMDFVISNDVLNDGGFLYKVHIGYVF